MLSDRNKDLESCNSSDSISTGLLNGGKFCVRLFLIVFTIFNSLLEGHVWRSSVLGSTLPPAVFLALGTTVAVVKCLLSLFKHIH